MFHASCRKTRQEKRRRILGDDIKIEKKREIGVITFNKPQTLNVMDTKMLQELGRSIIQIEKDETLRA